MSSRHRRHHRTLIVLMNLMYKYNQDYITFSLMPHLHTLCTLSSFFRYTTYISLWLSVNAPKKQMRIWQVGKKTLYNIEYSVSQFNITIRMLPVQCSQGPYEHHLRSWAGLHWIFCPPCWSPPLRRQYWWFCSGSWDCLSHSCIRFDSDIKA